jgi:anti-anti-sigma factor
MSEQAVTTQLTGPDRVRKAPPARTRSDGRNGQDSQRALLGIETQPAGHETLVVVSGAIDIVTEQALHNGLRQALARSDRGIDLDLSGVDFCDCSGLNVLLRLRKHALEQGKHLTVRAAGSAVLRLFSITGTLRLFTVDGHPDGTAVTSEVDGTDRTPDAPPAVALRSDIPLGNGDTDGDTDQDLRVEVAQLRRAMQTRPVIDLARGVLMASFGLSAEDSWQVLVRVSQNTNTKLREVADHLVSAVTGDPLSQVFRHQIAETVAGLRALSENPEPPSPHP